MSELTREQVERECQWLIEEHCGSAAKKWLDTDAALRATITQQAQELADAKSELSAWKKHGHSKEQQLAAMTQLNDQYAAQDLRGCRKISELCQHLSASQARVKELEDAIDEMRRDGSV